MNTVIQILENWGIFGLIIVAFTEASIFIVPPDVLLLPMSTNRPHLSIWYSILTIFSSVLGALFGYWLGKKVGPPILKKFASDKMITKAEGLYKRHGILALIIVGITPIPFKVFAILGGVLNVPIRMFVIGAMIGRIIRFLPLSSAIYYLGDEVQPYIEEVTSTSTGFFSVITLGFIIVAFVVARQRIKIARKSGSQ